MAMEEWKGRSHILYQLVPFRNLLVYIVVGHFTVEGTDANTVLIPVICWYFIPYYLLKLVKDINKQTSFLLKRNRPNDLNKMISKVCGCKMGQGE